MPQDPSFFTPSPMEGQGGYNRSSQVQAAGLSPAIPLLQHAARTVALPAGSQPIVIADYGSSDGHNSLLPLGAAIAILRQRIGPDRAISVVHTDLPENDFSILFETLNTDPNSYLRRDHAVFSSAVGRSFYEQILPTGSVTRDEQQTAMVRERVIDVRLPRHGQLGHSFPVRTCAERVRET